MYSYNLAKSADNETFNRACSLIEANYKNLTKENLLVDVDGSQIQIYMSKGNKIKVVNDCEVDAVYIDSAVALRIVEEYFS